MYVSLQDVHTGWIEGTAIIVTVCIVVTVASVNDYQKDKQFRALNKKKSDILIKVIRHGKNINVSIYDLVSLTHPSRRTSHSSNQSKPHV